MEMNDSRTSDQSAPAINIEIHQS